jgi:hypothetical protein
MYRFGITNIYIYSLIVRRRSIVTRKIVVMLHSFIHFHFRFKVSLGVKSMFGFFIQTQFSVFESKKWWARTEKILFGFCTQFLHLRIFTIQLILNLSKMKTTFTCFHFNFLYSILLFNIIIYIFFLSSFSLVLSVSLTLLFAGTKSARGDGDGGRGLVR